MSYTHNAVVGDLKPAQTLILNSLGYKANTNGKVLITSLSLRAVLPALMATLYF